MTSDLIRPKIDITNVRIASAEVFTKGDKERVNNRLSEILSGPATNNGINGTNRSQSYSWTVKDRKAFFELLSKPQHFPFGDFSTELMDRAIKTIVITGWDIDMLPFYYISARVDINPSFFVDQKPEKMGYSLVGVTHPLRLFIQSLQGLIGSLRIPTPSSPMVTWVNGVVSDDDMTRLVQRTTSSPKPIPTEVFRSAYTTKRVNYEDLPLFPFDLEQDSVIQQRSVVIEASNVVLLYGISNQLAFYGHRTPYVMVLTTDKGLADQGPLFETDIFSFPSGDAPGVIGFGLSTLTSTVAINGWLQSKNDLITKLESDASYWRSESSDLIGHAKNIAEIVRVGMEAASLSSDIGLVRRLFSSPLEVWKNRRTRNGEELPLVGSGVLSYLASDTLNMIDRHWSTVSEIRDETDWLIRHVATQASIDSSKAMIDLTQEIAKSSNRVFWLTVVLIAFTATIAVLTYFLLTH